MEEVFSRLTFNLLDNWSQGESKPCRLCPTLGTGSSRVTRPRVQLQKNQFFCLGLAPAQANTPLPTSLHTAGEDSPWSRFGEASPTQNESQTSRLSLGQKLTQGPGGSPPPTRTATVSLTLVKVKHHDKLQARNSLRSWGEKGVQQT